MPLIRSQIYAYAQGAPRRGRNAAPSCRGGVSSVLRLGQPTPGLIPMARALAQRLAAAASSRDEAA